VERKEIVMSVEMERKGRMVTSVEMGILNVVGILVVGIIRKKINKQAAHMTATWPFT
jgi:hypothetical protein